MAVYCPWVNKVFIPVRKNGSTAISRTLRKKGGRVVNGPTENAGGVKGDVVVMFRCPLDRLSSWYNLCKEKRVEHRDNYNLPPRPEDDFPVYIERILDIPDWDRDKHFMSQWRTLRGWNIDTTVRWDFKALGATLDISFDMPEENMNATSGKGEWTSKLIHKVLDDEDYWTDWSIFRKGK